MGTKIRNYCRFCNFFARYFTVLNVKIQKICHSVTQSVTHQHTDNQQVLQK